MALTERKEEDLIEIVGPYRIIQVRTATVVERDGVEIAREFHREALQPDASMTGRSSFVQGLARVVWTPEIKNAWNARQTE